MTTSTQDDFNKSFLVSITAHVVMIALAFLSGKILSTVFPNTDVEIIKSSIRVDVVGMPKFTVQELKALQREPVAPKEPEVAKGPKEEVVKDTEDVIKKDDLVIEEKGKTKTSFLNIINDASSKKVAPKAQPKGAATGKSNSNINSLVLEGNRLSQGSALVGDYTDEQNSAFGGYVQALPGIIRQFWKLPSYLMEKNLRCRIKIFLTSAGTISRLEMVESSGTEEFDSRAEKAIRDAAPFPKPSDEVATRLTKSGIILGFPL
jgi:colicin import membrane protein